MGDQVMGDKIVQKGNYTIGKIEAPARRQPNQVLILTANPQGTPQLRVDREMRAISMAINSGLHRERLRVVTAADVRYYDLQHLLPHENPVAVHFIGHGNQAGGIVLSDDGGYPLAVQPEDVAGTFQHLGQSVRCVVLNACYTRAQAKAIAVHVPCVVGTTMAIRDDLAAEFAAGFYTAISAGRSVDTAFHVGRNRVALGSGPAGDDDVVLEGDGRKIYLHD
ncbi:CHAT domain-containing protein [Dactylosporangium sp. NBC_01737]|uniref:CHAT domain-containing protein n=1 Tax=Dactylosporangium sp. NBC_01737 TaxID=2975959 RepID=UPI002E103A6E|nr:CHAT domain-containing protein [Dactylosporangium sp. NBC_01737]